MEGLQEDTGDGSMLCTEHPFKNNTPAGGICAFCLQEKLGKLVSSSFPIAVFPSSSTSSSPSFRSESTITTTVSSSTAIPPPSRFTNSTSLSVPNTTDNNYNHHHHSNRSRILYLLKKKKNKDVNILVNAGAGSGAGGQSNDRRKNLVFKRSKSTSARSHYKAENDTPNKRGFWAYFLHSQKPSNSSSFNNSKSLRGISSNSMRAFQQDTVHKDIIMENEINESPFDRKVSRSRSVGCGSRSFSGDFFERISTGFGDCTLRRVESQREGKVKVNMNTINGGRDCIQERVRCGGLFSGFMITSSSSSSSSSSNWVGSNGNNEGNVAGKVAGEGNRQHSRSRSWGWALASPMRAFSKQSSSSRSQKKNANPNPNLAAIPSLLSVSS